MSFIQKSTGQKTLHTKIFPQKISYITTYFFQKTPDVIFYLFF